MKPVIRYHSQLLHRRSFAPRRVINIRIRPVKLEFMFNRVRFGVKPQIQLCV